MSDSDSYVGNVHLAGEFFVAAELAKRGYAVSLTLGNAKAIDLIAERDGCMVAVQVKARRNATGWPMPLDDTKIMLNEMGQPVEYFILTPEQVRAGKKRYGNRATLYMAQAKQGHDKWHVIDDGMKP
jgi:PD-(D/E)XK endonuclease